MSIDPITLEVARNRFAPIADEMGVVLRRTAYSPNIKERADCSAAVFVPSGEMLAQAEHIPVHLGSMPASVAAVLDRFGDDVEPATQYAVNDPFVGGTHLNDLTLVRPVFSAARSSPGWPTGPTTPTSVARLPARCRPTPSPSTRKATGWRRRRRSATGSGSPSSSSRSSPPPGLRPSASAICRPSWAPTRRERSGCSAWQAIGGSVLRHRRCPARLRRAADAGRPRRLARRDIHVHRFHGVRGDCFPSASPSPSTATSSTPTSPDPLPRWQATSMRSRP